jgi:hypothetical protein
MKKKRRSHAAIFSIAICVGIFCAWCCVLLMAEEYDSARRKLDVHKQEVQAWEACRQTKPSYFKSNSEAVSSCLKNLKEAQDDPWVSLPKGQLVGLFALTALASAAGGSLVTWIVVWLGGLSIYRFIRWLASCCWRKPGRRVNNTNIKRLSV